MFSAQMTIAGFDPELEQAIAGERRRQEDHIELIASENYASPRVLEAQGSVLTNKYAEGYPGRRYYGGCEYVDVAERLAIERAKQLFGAAYANVQPHSGSQANAAAYLALLNPGDPILGMSLDHGGHLTHGAKVNFSGKIFKAFQYGIRADSGEIDYEQVAGLARGAPAEADRGRLFGVFARHRLGTLPGHRRFGQRAISWWTWRTSPDWSPPACIRIRAVRRRGHDHHPQDAARSARRLDSGAAERRTAQEIQLMVFPGIQGGPLMHVIAAKAVAFLEALQPEFKVYSAQVIANARTMTQVLQQRGYRIVSGGTDNHLFLLDLIDKNVTGKDADAALGRAHITVNKNAVPNDPRPPAISSGLRIGTPAVTTRGFKETEVRQFSGWIADVLDHMGDEATVQRVRDAVVSLCGRFPVYG